VAAQCLEAKTRDLHRLAARFGLGLYKDVHPVKLLQSDFHCKSTGFQVDIFPTQAQGFTLPSLGFFYRTGRGLIASAGQDLGDGHSTIDD